MVEREENIQLDLFSQSGKPEAQISPERARFFSYIRSYERNILLIIGIAVTGIICFSIGVEKGKRWSASKVTTSLEASPDAQPKAVIARSVVPVNALQAKQFQPLPILSVNPALPQEAKRTVESGNGYTIQLASYKLRSSAQKEAELLKKKGLVPLVISKGNYTILCVGKFPSKETAQSLLVQLTKKYQGCHLRRL